MPSKSDKQKKFMAAAAHNPKFAKEAGIPQKVAKEFNQADSAKKSKKVKVSKPPKSMTSGGY
jgi:hypothetical protein